MITPSADLARPADRCPDIQLSHTKQEEIWKLYGIFTLKTHQIFSIHNTQCNNHRSWICIWVKLGQESQTIIETSLFKWKALPWICSPLALKCIACVFKFLPGLKRVFQGLRFLDGLVWTVDLTVETKLRFRDGLVWTVGLTVETKLRLRDGSVWTVGLTVEIKLRLRCGLVLVDGRPNLSNKAPFSG